MLTALWQRGRLESKRSSRAAVDVRTSTVARITSHKKAGDWGLPLVTRFL